MTTTIKITTNGDYVAEGTVTHTPIDHDGEIVREPVKVGPGSNVSVGVHFRSNHRCTLELVERPATDEEKAEVKPAKGHVIGGKHADDKKGDDDPDPAPDTEHE